MLRIHQSNSAENAKGYYTSGLEDAHDYYAAGANKHGQWFGEGAKLLGLSGDVSQRDFFRLCDNRRPEDDSKLNPRENSIRKIGYDVSFSAPKSLSIVQAVLGDGRIVDVFQQVVRTTMKIMEYDAHVRVRRDGVVETRKTGNLVWAEFTHFESRPVKGLTDPQLHCHAYTFNTSYDGKEQRFKAVEFFTIKRDARFYEAIFHSELAKAVSKLGYSVENKPYSFEIAGIGEANLKRFSRRTAEIEKLAKELNANAEQKSKLGAYTRQNKQDALKGEAKLAEWKARLDRSELDLDQPASCGAGMTPKQALDLAIENMFERSSVVQLRRVVADALQHSLGSCSYSEIMHEVKLRRDLVVAVIDGTSYATTTEVLAEEKAIIRFLENTRNSSSALAPWYREKTEQLDADQRSTIEAIMQCRDKVIVVQGRAGSGKTTLMSKAVSAIKSVGQEVHSFAPTAAAVQVLQAEGFKRSETVQQLLVNPKLQKQIQDKVIWVDEAGLLSSKDFKRLFEIAAEQNSRVVLSGDSSQHGSVARGTALEMICKSQLVTVKETRSIYRQRTAAYKRAVTAISLGDVDAAIQILDDMGSIQEVDLLDERMELEAKEYVQSLSQYKTVLAISPTHAEGRLLTAAIRSQMRVQSKLGDVELNVATYRNQNLTEAQRKMAHFYKTGDVIRFHQNTTGGFKKSEIVRVASVSGAGLLVESQSSGSARMLDISHAKHFNVFDQGSINVAVGDRVRITRNMYSINGKRLLNGNLHNVTAIPTKGTIELDSKYLIRTDSGSIDYGYVSTSHSSQGKTADKVIISQSDLSFSASSLQQFYVSVSRGRDAIKIFTDSKDDLKSAVRNSMYRMTAMELESRNVQRSRSRSSKRHHSVNTHLSKQH